MSHGRQPALSEAKVKSFALKAMSYGKTDRPTLDKRSPHDRARDWLHAIAAGTILGSKAGFSIRSISAALKTARGSCAKYLALYRNFGPDGLSQKRQSANRLYDNPALKDAVFALFHEPPSNHNINRTNWRMEYFRVVLANKGHSARPAVLRKIIKDAGYRWRKAKVVLTSRDPEYSVKLASIQNILSKLTKRDVFFSIDEFGPFSVKMKGGRSLVGPGVQPVVPQWQKSKGCLIITAALELSTNQVTHFYSKKKNTAEMIKSMDILVEQHSDRKQIFLSWDAASWHISKDLNSHIKRLNDDQAWHVRLSTTVITTL